MIAEVQVEVGVIGERVWLWNGWHLSHADHEIHDHFFFTYMRRHISNSACALEVDRVDISYRGGMLAAEKYILCMILAVLLALLVIL